jgi:hypothetical protein
MENFAATIAEDYRQVRAIVLKSGETVEQEDSQFPYELARVVAEETLSFAAALSQRGMLPQAEK